MNVSNIPIHKRKRRLPKPKLEVVYETSHAVVVQEKYEIEEDRPPHEIRRQELYEEYGGRIPLKDIFVDSRNGVELFRNPETGGWCYNPKSIGGVTHE